MNKAFDNLKLIQEIKYSNFIEDIEIDLNIEYNWAEKSRNEH